MMCLTLLLFEGYRHVNMELQHCVTAADRPLVIAHRGASGYLPEHTLVAKAMSYGMGADLLEQDVVLSQDDQPVVLHDVHIDTVTDVAAVFPDRARDDGRFYAIDFTLDELKRLRVHERIDHKTGARVFAGRFPAGRSDFTIPTLAEEIELVQGLNSSTGRNVGICVELKTPSWHRDQGRDLTARVVEVLDRYGYRNKADNAIIECFDEHAMLRLRNEFQSKLTLVQLLRGQPRSPADLQRLARFADGIGPPIEHLFEIGDNGPRATQLVKHAHACGLTVFPWTLRVDALPDRIDSIEQLMQLTYVEAGADGAFSDFPDRDVAFIRKAFATE